MSKQNPLKCFYPIFHNLRGALWEGYHLNVSSSFTCIYRYISFTFFLFHSYPTGRKHRSEPWWLCWVQQVSPVGHSPAGRSHKIHTQDDGKGRPGAVEGAAQPSPAIQQHRLSIHWITGRICRIQVTKELVEQYISLSLPKELVEQTRLGFMVHIFLWSNV